MQSTDSKIWKQRLQFELNGADYNQTLIFNSPEEIPILPFYTSENKAVTYSVDIDTKPAVFLYCSSIEKTIERILFWKEKSVFHFFVTFHSSILQKNDFFSRLPSEVTVFETFPDLVMNNLKEGKKIEPYLFDYKQVTKNKIDIIPTVFVDTTLYQNAGANAFQQVAYALAQLSEYLKCFDNSLKISNLYIFFKLAIGSNFLLEITKIRLLRKMANELLERLPFSAQVMIISEPSQRNLSLLKTPHNQNVIDISYEMAVLGGSDFVFTKNATFYKKQQFKNEQENIEKIQQIVKTRHSSFLDNSFALGGIFYEMLKKTTDLYQKIEKNGGFIPYVQSNSLQKNIAQKAKEEQFFFDERLKKYPFPNLKSQIADKTEWEIYPFTSKNTHQTANYPILPKRLWEKWEKIHLKK